MDQSVAHANAVRYFFDTEQSEPFADTVATEHEMMIQIPEREKISVICTPSDLEALVVGMLYTNGIIASRGDVISLDFSPDWVKAMVQLRPGIMKRRFVPAEDPPDMEDIRKLINRFCEGGKLFRQTGAMHSCLISVNSDIKYTAYDIGRYNAIDKAVGMALAHEEDFSKAILFTSGRAPLGAVYKAYAAGIPVFVSRSAPTDKGVAFAQQHGIKLFGFAREATVNLYT